jgi:vacuolar-type H+-ATPase subunit E/Vma4
MLKQYKFFIFLKNSAKKKKLKEKMWRNVTHYLLLRKTRCLNTMFKTVITKSMEESFKVCIQQTVRILSEKYLFDTDEALSHLGMMDDLKPAIQLAKPKGVVDVAPKRKPKFPLPFSGEVLDGYCQAIVFHGGLFSQCLKDPKSDSNSRLCNACENQAKKNKKSDEVGFLYPPLGFITERIDRGEDWADPKGRRPIPFTKVMKLKEITQEDVIAEVSALGMNFDTNHFIEPDVEKRGRKRGEKKIEVKPVEDEDEQEEVVFNDLMDQAMDNTSEKSEVSKVSKKSKKSEEEKAAEKAEKDAEKARKEAEKKAEKARKDAEKEAEKARKAAEKEAEKARKAAEKGAKKGAKMDADEKRQPLREIQEEKMEEVVDAVEEVVDAVEETDELGALSPIMSLEHRHEEEEEEEELVVKMKPAPKMKQFKANGERYMYDLNDPEQLVFKLDNPDVAVGRLAEGCLELYDDDEEEEEDLSRDED